MLRIIKFEMLNAKYMIAYSLGLSLLYYIGLFSGFWGSFGLSDGSGLEIFIGTAWMGWFTELNKSGRFISYSRLPITPFRLGITRSILIFMFYISTFWVIPISLFILRPVDEHVQSGLFMSVFYSFIIFGMAAAGDVRAALGLSGRKGMAKAWVYTGGTLTVIMVALALVKKQMLGVINNEVQIAIIIIVEIFLGVATAFVFKSRKEFIK